jgi:hypothetical protein
LGRGATLEFPLGGLTAKEAKAVHIATYDETIRSWVPVKTTVDRKDKVIRAFTPHFSWWAPWTWDWPAVGAGVNQGVGELVGKRSGSPECKRGTKQPDWVAQLVGVGADNAVSVRSCAESEGDVLAVELVNNRPYGQVLTYGSGVEWGWREDGDSVTDRARNVIMSGVLGKDKLYLPPRGRASVGIEKLRPSETVAFHIGIEQSTLVGDLLDVTAGDLLVAGGNKLVGPLVSECGSALATSVPIDKLGSPSAIRDQMFGSVGCVKAAFYKAVAAGLLDKQRVEELAATLDGLKKANIVGWLLKAYDVEWKLLDLYVDLKLVPEVAGLGYGFSVRSKGADLPDDPGPMKPRDPAPTHEPKPPAPVPTREPQPRERASNLSVELTENPFTCNGDNRRLGTLSGAHPGERIEFSSQQVGGLRPGTADGNGRLSLSWDCSSSDADTQWTVRVSGSSGGSTTFEVTGRAPEASDPPPATHRGFRVEDSYLGGTWARHDPGDGSWYSKGNRPGNAAYWFSNGLGVAVDCARMAASYTVKISGRTETWSWWLHVTDNTWIPAATVHESSSDGTQGVPHC